MRILTTIPQHNLRAVPAVATAIEAAGYDGIFTLENRHNPFLPLAVSATITDRVQLSTGIALAFVRSPMTVANIAWDLQEASRGRFVLGLGPQIRAHNERRFSVPWSPPAPRMREYVLALRAIWRTWKYGEPLRFEGEHYHFSLMTPNFVPEGTGQALPAVVMAAVGPAMQKVAAEVADGIYLHPVCTRRYIDEQVLPRIALGLEASGRSREQFEIAGGGFMATGADDATVARNAEWVRHRIGFYGSTPAYWPVLELHGYGDLGRKLNAMTREGQWDKLAAQVPDDLLHLVCAVGRHDQIAQRLEQRYAGAVDTVYASLSSEIRSDLPPDLIQDIQRIPRRFTGFRTDA